MKKVLFVCLGNICRSPLAEGLFAAHVAELGFTDRVSADSAGTSNWHVGQAPSPGSRRAAEKLGHSIAHQKCRQVNTLDFQTFDLILGMDQDNVRNLELLAGSEPRKARIALFLEYAGRGAHDVPDPWGEPDHEFDDVARQISDAVPAILRQLENQTNGISHKAPGSPG